MRLPAGVLWQPDGRKVRLLQAALLPGAAAVTAWRAWRVALLTDDLAEGSALLLPQLYRQLTRLGVEDALLPKLKGIYRRTWYSNQLLLHAAAQVLRPWAADGLPAMLFGGAALMALGYGDHGLRPLGGVDVALPAAAVPRARDLAERLGWTAGAPAASRALPWGRAIPLHDPGGHLLRLHWSHPSSRRAPPAAASRAAAAARVVLGDVELLVLNPVDQLLDLCERGMGEGGAAAVLRVADTAALLRSAAVALDWAALGARARERRVLWPVGAMLQTVGNTVGVPLPPGVPQALPIPVNERLAYGLVRPLQRLARRSSAWRTARRLLQTGAT